eukprot:g531.t1
MSVKPKALEEEPVLCKPKSHEAFNTAQLSKELASAVEYDRLYRKTDDLKKRVITEAKDYDEFRNRVLCADLKPLKTKDIQHVAQGGTALNKGAAAAPGGARASGTRAKRVGRRDRRAPRRAGAAGAGGVFRFAPPTAPPSSAADFERNWRRNCPTPAAKLDYLMLIPPDAWAALFPTELDSATLGDVVTAFAHAAGAGASGTGGASGAESASGDGGGVRDAAAMLARLRGLSQVGRFAFGVGFFGADNVAACASLFAWLEGHVGGEQGHLGADDVAAVRGLYLP